MKTLCIVALILAVASAKYVSRTNADAHVELAEMEKDAFGNTFISAVQMALHTNLPVDEVSALLDKVLDELDSEQQAANAVNQTEQIFCDETFSTIANELTKTRDSIAASENIINVNNEVKDNAKRNLDQAATDLDETVAALENGAVQRESEHTAWVDSDYEHNEAITALEEASKLIKHMIHGVAFSQIRERYNQVQETLKNNKKHAVLFKPLIVSLTDLATKLNYEQVIKILDLLKSIQDALTASREAAATSESKSQADWDALQTLLSEQKRSLQDTISRLNSLITTSDEIIAQTINSLNSFKEYLAYLITTEEFTTAWCNSHSDSYTTETRERSRQTEILERLQEHINDRWGQVSAFLQARKN
jgi:hypothetical protein